MNNLLVAWREVLHGIKCYNLTINNQENSPANFDSTFLLTFSMDVTAQSSQAQ